VISRKSGTGFRLEVVLQSAKTLPAIAGDAVKLGKTFCFG
jgi:hypothetical protein